MVCQLYLCAGRLQDLVCKIYYKADTAVESYVRNKESNYFIIKLVSNRPSRGPVFQFYSVNIFISFTCSEGFFFAVKEVSLLDEGNQGKQSIFQLQQVGAPKIFIKTYDLIINSYMEVFLYMMSLAFLSGNISFE